VFWRSADGSGEEERLTLGDSLQSPGTWSPDGKNLVFVDIAPATSADLWVLKRDGLRASALVSTPVSQGEPAFSPDGRLLAYESDESGTKQIYVQPFPGPAGKVQISTDGGSEARWSRDGRQLFYRTRDNKMMSVAILTRPALPAGPPTKLFEGRYKFSDTGGTPGYGLAPDGRFLFVQAVEREQPATQINLVINWFEVLKIRTRSAVQP
jgi:dipeptidyl aminopeptidase/acylaminoacyl peptidase